MDTFLTKIKENCEKFKAVFQQQSVVEIFCYNLMLTEIDLTHEKRLRVLKINKGNLQRSKLPDSIEILEIVNTSLETIILPENTKFANLSNNQIKKIETKQSLRLNSLNLSNNPINCLDVQNNNLLSDITIFNTNITKIVKSKILGIWSF